MCNQSSSQNGFYLLMLISSTGSPFTCRVTDANQILVSGAGVKMSPLNKPASLLIDSRGAEMSDCKVSVLSTSGQEIPVNLEVIEGGKFKADFLPFEVGEFTVHSIQNVFTDIQNVRIYCCRSPYCLSYDEWG